MKRLILADVKSYSNKGKSTGHYFSLAENYIELFSDVVDVKIGGGPVYLSKFKKNEVFLLPYDSKSSEPKWRQIWHTLMNCRYLYKHATNDDVVVMQHSAAATFMIGIMLFACKKNNIFVIAYDKNPINSLLKRIVYSFSSHRIKGVLTSNEDVGKSFCKPYCMIPDYIFAGKISDIPNVSYSNKKYDFVMIGMIWPDKGVLEAARHLANTPYKVLIAGGVAYDWLEKELKQVCDNSDNIELHLGYVSDNDYHYYLDNAKYSLLNYQGSYAERSSGVVLDALFRGVPIVGHHSHATKLVKDMNLGLIYKDISEFMPKEVINEDVYSRYRKNVLDFLRYNKVYKQKIINFIEL
ncbi:hypothetical protein LPYR103PRE_23820 [Segatella asaccharophila]